MGVSERVLHHAVRRSVQAIDDMTRNRQHGHAVEDVKMSHGALLVFALTMLAFSVLYSLMQYTLHHVVATLCMIEAPGTAVTISVSDSEEESHIKISDKEAEAEAFIGTSLPTMTISKTKPITSKMRTTIHHIVAQAGWTARWRGMGYGILYSFGAGVLLNIFDAIIPSIPGKVVIISMLVSVLVAPLHLIWTHATIAMPGKTWKARLAAVRGSYKQLALPAAVYEGVQILVLFMGSCLLSMMQLDLVKLSDENATKCAKVTVLLRAIGAVLFILGSCLFVVLPAHVQLVRVEASMLPDDDDTIVPFDRTFGGKVVPKILGGTGAVSFIDAWRSFDYEARIRLVKLYLKIFLISTAFIIVAGHVIMLEVFALALPAVKAYVAQAHAQAQAQASA